MSDYPISSPLFNIASAIAGPVVVAVGRLIAFGQSVLRLQAPAIRVEGNEKRMLERVFENSLAIDKIRLIEGRSGVFGVNDRAFTLGNTIYFKDQKASERPDLLVHECVHVWQYQHIGARYTTDALGAQQFVEEPYNWQREIQRGHENWVEFNKESQAQFLQDLYNYGELVIDGTTTTRGSGAFYDADGGGKIGRFVFNGTDHTELANDAVSAVRG